MQFNKLINRYLKEEDEAPSREDRIKALSNLEDPEDRAQREREAEREAYKQYWQRREEQERQEGETRRQEAQRRDEEQKRKDHEYLFNKWSNPIFQRVTRDHVINNEPGGEYSIEFRGAYGIIYEVWYNRGTIDDIDEAINDWEVASVVVNLKRVFGENYYVVIRKEQAPEEYEYAEDEAYEKVLEEEYKRLRDEWDGQ